MTRGYLLSKIGTQPPQTKLVVLDQDAHDIMQQIRAKHKECVDAYDSIAEDFYDSDIFYVCQNLWNFCKKNIQYREETIDAQYASSPQTILNNGFGDCKSYALFIGGVLDALKRKGMPVHWCYRFASENYFSAVPGHVFVVVTTPAGEIWVDPVLQQFNQDHYFPHYQDRKINTTRAAKMTGCEMIGASTQAVGKEIMAISPNLAVVPVVGWVASAVGEVVGGLLAIFGSAHSLSSGVDKLIERYEYLVLGENVTSYTKVNENDKAAAQKWFSIVLGVPIYDVYRFYALKDIDPDHLQPLGNTYAQRAANYFKSAPETVGQVTTDQVIAAAHIADTMTVYPGVMGSWKNMLAAPALISTAEPSYYVDGTGQLTTAAGAPVSSNSNLILWAAIAAIAFIIIK